ncbi:MAG: virulence RhuM family protein, partial [Thermoguttaceae bacterium]|nr:virulence RhuM family protein [Thermoguttaceae bacterium]
MRRALLRLAGYSRGRLSRSRNRRDALSSVGDAELGRVSRQGVRDRRRTAQEPGRAARLLRRVARANSRSSSVPKAVLSEVARPLRPRRRLRFDRQGDPNVLRRDAKQAPFRRYREDRRGNLAVAGRRRQADKPNMNLKTWNGSIVRKGDVIVAKNYLDDEEIDELNRL